MTGELPAEHGMRADCRLGRGDNRPCDLRHGVRHAPQYFALEVLDDLRPALLPPHLGARNLAAVRQREGVGQGGEGIGERLVVVGVVRRLLVAARAGPQRSDAELLHHLSMVFGGGPFFRRRRGGVSRLRGGCGRTREVATERCRKPHDGKGHHAPCGAHRSVPCHEYSCRHSATDGRVDASGMSGVAFPHALGDQLGDERVIWNVTSCYNPPRQAA